MEDFRRIQKTGKSTFIISLPKKWAERNSVRPGTEAAVLENNDGSLTISTKPGKRSERAAIHATKNLEHNLQRVMASYFAGVRFIEIHGKNAAEIAGEARARLSGIEVMDEKSDYIVMEVFDRGDSFTIDTILKRMHISSATMFRICSRMLNGEIGLENEAKRREDETDRLYILALRTLSLASSKPAISISKALAAKALERISDHLEQVSDEIKNIGNITYPETAMELLLDLQEEVVHNFLDEKSSTDTLEKIIHCKKQIKNLTDEAEKEKALSKRRAVKKILENCLRINDYLFDISEITDDIIAAQD